MLRRLAQRTLEKAGLGTYSGRVELGFELLLRIQRLRSRSPFYVIQVGAQDGVTGDPIRERVLSEGWHGVLVEPRRAIFEQLRRNYSGQQGLSFVNAAICESNGMRTLHALDASDPSLPLWAHGLGTFDLETLLRHEAELPGLRDRLVTETVVCRTWQSLLEEARPRKVDLLQVDAEGMDYELVRTFPLARVRPGLIRYEHKLLSHGDRTACEDYLVTSGYVPVVERCDTCAIATGWQLPESEGARLAHDRRQP